MANPMMGHLKTRISYESLAPGSTSPVLPWHSPNPSPPCPLSAFCAHKAAGTCPTGCPPRAATNKDNALEALGHPGSPDEWLLANKHNRIIARTLKNPRLRAAMLPHTWPTSTQTKVTNEPGIYSTTTKAPCRFASGANLLLKGEVRPYNQSMMNLLNL